MTDYKWLTHLTQTANAAMRNVNTIALARLDEMQQTGFDTNTPFADVNQAMYVGVGRKPFLLVSPGTDTTYFVVVSERVGSTLRVAVAVHQGSRNPEARNLRKMTLRCNANGNVSAVPGW